MGERGLEREEERDGERGVEGGGEVKRSGRDEKRTMKLVWKWRGWVGGGGGRRGG